jgi:hypothetical protein
MRRRLDITHAPAALRLVALTLFAALAFAADAPAFDGTRASVSSASNSNSSASNLKTSNASGSQGRRRRGRLRRAPDALLPGVWGGSHIRFEATDGGADIEFDCARATVEGRILVDGAGRFSAEGLYYQGRGAAMRAEEGPRGEPVSLAGRVGGSLMRLTVTRGGQSVGTFTLARGREPELTKCM